jgi:hypothetical protein
MVLNFTTFACFLLEVRVHLLYIAVSTWLLQFLLIPEAPGLWFLVESFAIWLRRPEILERTEMSWDVLELGVMHERVLIDRH